MAKWGEGDERWKVTDLGEQGRNVNSWHWEESNVLPWCQSRLKELFKDVTLVDDGKVRVVTNGTVKVTGDAIINRRKGKVIPAYELDVTVDWKGTTLEDGEPWTGELQAPYISEENHDEDPEVQIRVKESGAEAEKVRSAVVQHGRKVAYGIFRNFVDELRKGGPGLGADRCEESVSKGVDKKNGEDWSEKTKKAALEKSKSRVEKKSVEIVEHYYASAKDIYECFTNEDKVKAFTGSSASINATPGGSLVMFGGSIEGTFTALNPHSELEMDWRFSSWPDGSLSKVKIMLNETEKGSVTLTLKQTGIPDTDRFGNHDVVNMTQAGWKQQVLSRMKQVFGYGM